MAWSSNLEVSKLFVDLILPTNIPWSVDDGDWDPEGITKLVISLN